MANKCIFEYIGLAGATSYQVEVQPDLEIIPCRVQNLHNLGSGKKKLYKQGYIFEILLTWDKTRLFQAAQMREIKDIFNATTGITFYPYPESAPDVSFNVAWYDERLNFPFIGGIPNVGYCCYSSCLDQDHHQETD